MTATPHALRPAPSPALPPIPGADRILHTGDLQLLLRTEWLLPDGLGGYAMGTALGSNTRRYHALYTAAARPPLTRLSALAATADTLILRPDTPDRRDLDLSTFRFGDHGLHPAGHLHLSEFRRADPFTTDSAHVEWSYVGDGAAVTKRLRSLWRRQPFGGAVLTYTVNTAGAPARLLVRPLVALRDANALQRRWADPDSASAHHPTPHARVWRDPAFTLHLVASAGRFEPQHDWWFNFRYDRERERLYDCDEDLFTPGCFTLDIPAHAGAGDPKPVVLTIAVALADADHDPASLLRDALGPDQRAKHLRDTLRAAQHATPAAARLAPLVQAADDFVVPRAIGDRRFTTILAGYPWFADWGRDALISLPGILLTTGRLDEARSLLEVFAAHLRRGLAPNFFDERTGEPHYNTADASFLFLRAAAMYARAAAAANRPDPFPEPLRKACLDIVENVVAGSDYSIGVDRADSLVFAGDETTQLTWMDAKRDGVVFTSRHGKPVEINALWAHGLRELADLLRNSHPARARELRALGDRAAASLAASFWLDDPGCMADRLIPDVPGFGAFWTQATDIRPNQLWAAALEHSGLSREQRRSIVRVCRERLLTPVGLRTLDPKHPAYVPRYEGSMWDRDRAYHNGTVWPWLIGVYGEAALRAEDFSEHARRALALELQPILDSMRHGCLGQIAEIYDGDPPHRPEGCPAQAWSVAETLRVAAML